MAPSRTNEAAPDKRRMTEPGPKREGTDVGGIVSNADRGLRESLQRSSERGEADPTGAATIGQGSSGGREPRLDLGGKAEPGSAGGAPAPSRRAPSEEMGPSDRSSDSVESVGSPHDRGAIRTGAQRTDTVSPDGDSARRGHDPDEPPDEGPIESLGRSVSEVVTGPLEDGENRDASTRAP
jgi:hypothetical protein